MSPQLTNSVAESLASLPAAERDEVLASVTEEQAKCLLKDWNFWARPQQQPPEGSWRYWLILAGRGWGKTKTGSQTVKGWTQKYSRIHLIGSTTSDTRNVMVEGPSGLLACFPHDEQPDYQPAKHLIKFSNGCIAETFSADEPERLRGPQCGAFWADETCAWRFLQDAWDNVMFGFRTGEDPRGVITTTPKPSAWLKNLIKNPQTVITRGSSYENRSWLAPAFFEEIIKRYEGTRLGRQEINAEVLEDIPGALWKQSLIDQHRIGMMDVKWDQILRIVIAIDPAVTAGPESDETGIVAVALTRSQHVLVLDDETCRDSPLGWANKARALYYRRRADRIIGEVNNGGDLVEANIRTVDPLLPFRAVRASRGKARRAEPVAALYEQGRVHHVGNFPDMERQMCGYVPGDEDRGESPDRMDALVWGITDLLIDREEITVQAEAHWETISPI